MGFMVSHQLQLANKKTLCHIYIAIFTQQFCVTLMAYISQFNNNNISKDICDTLR